MTGTKNKGSKNRRDGWKQSPVFGSKDKLVGNLELSYTPLLRTLSVSPSYHSPLAETRHSKPGLRSYSSLATAWPCSTVHPSCSALRDKTRWGQLSQTRGLLTVTYLGWVTLILSHHNLYFTPFPFLWVGGRKKHRKKINQNDVWLVRSEVKPSRVENRPGIVVWVQKIGWASSSLGCNYLLKTKRNKKCAHIYIYTLRDRYLSNLRVTHIRLCNVRANCSARGLCSFSTCTSATAQTCSQDARNASPNSAHFSSATASAPIKATTITSYSNIHNSILLVTLPHFICLPPYTAYKSHLDAS